MTTPCPDTGAPQRGDDETAVAFIGRVAFELQRGLGLLAERTARLEEQTATLMNQVSDMQLELRGLDRRIADLPSRRELWAGVAFLATTIVAMAGVAVAAMQGPP